MKNIKVKTPAKINLTLKVGKRRPDGFHPIESIMQAISLYDYLEISTCEGRGEIKLDGTSKEIPYDSANIAYKAARKYMEISGMELDVNIYIEKNIPVCAGLAGGSTNAAGVLFALNKLYGLLNDNEIFNICKTLGSDLNFCMKGSKQLCRGKGDEMTPLDFDEFALTLIKPEKLKISTKEAYSLFDDLRQKSNMPNDLEFTLLPHYEELRKLHALGFQMSGSGPTYFVKKALLDMDLGEGYTIIENLHAINHGVCEI